MTRATDVGVAPPGTSRTAGGTRVKDPLDQEAGRRRDRAGHASHARTWGWLSLLALAAITVIGAVIRYSGFTDLGLWRDDAWVALSARVGIGTAWHMWQTSPGFFFLERTLMVLSPNTTRWDLVLDYVAGVACIPAIYALTRYFRLSRPAALAAAVVVCASPIAAVYSTRVKEYEVDFLLSCLLLAVAEAVRRNPDAARTAALAVVSVLSFLGSASVGPVIIGAWVMVAIYVLRSRPVPRHVVVASAAAVAGCALVAIVFYSHLSPALTRFWEGNFVAHSSPGAFVSSLNDSAANTLGYLFGFTVTDASLRVLIVVAWLALSIVGLYRNEAMVCPALVVAAAFLASIAHVEPLGTGRTDLFLYPSLLLLLAGGATELVRLARAPAGSTAARARSKPRHRRRPAPVVAVSLGLAAALLSALYIDHAYTTRASYPGVDVQGLAAQIRQHELPGDHVFVSELMRYPWALYEDQPLVVQLGADWSTGFTVVSTNPNVFIAPSEFYEEASRPEAWARDMTRGPYTRLWYVWTSPLVGYNPSYAALEDDGWRPVRTLTAADCAATLLVRGS